MMTEERALDISEVLIQGDLSKLTPEQKLAYYLKVCESLKLNPYTKPFGYLRLSGGETLYALKNATDQLRDIHKVSIVSLERQQMGDLLTVTASARLPDGRTDFAIGAVPIKGLYGEALANAMMKAETKSKRRVTLSICGLGWTDESEISSISDAMVVDGPSLPPAPEGPADPPLRERDAPDRSPRRMITDPNDRVWQRWQEVAQEAMRLELELPDVNLPIGYQQLVAEANALRRQIDQAQTNYDQIEHERQQKMEGVK